MRVSFRNNAGAFFKSVVRIYCAYPLSVVILSAINGCVVRKVLQVPNTEGARHTCKLTCQDNVGINMISSACMLFPKDKVCGRRITSKKEHFAANLG